MKGRFKMFRRKGGMFYARDTETMSKESLGTKDREQASRLVAAKNQAQEQPALNKGMAKVYLAAASPEFALRTWTDVTEKYVTSGAESSKDRRNGVDTTASPSMAARKKATLIIRFSRTWLSRSKKFK